MEEKSAEQTVAVRFVKPHHSVAFVGSDIRYSKGQSMTFLKSRYPLRIIFEKSAPPRDNLKKPLRSGWITAVRLEQRNTVFLRSGSVHFVGHPCALRRMTYGSNRGKATESLEQKCFEGRTTWD